MARRTKAEKIPAEQLLKINNKIHPYDLIVHENPEKYVFRKPVPYTGECEYLKERGFGMQVYLEVYTEKEAVKEIKRLME